MDITGKMKRAYDLLPRAKHPRVSVYLRPALAGLANLIATGREREAKRAIVTAAKTLALLAEEAPTREMGREFREISEAMTQYAACIRRTCTREAA